jgi:DNA-binding transcriptional ArsR family regulator
MQSAADRASSLLKALANEKRLMLLCQLVDGEKSVGALTSLIGLAQSAVSQHLARLRRDGLVKTRRDSQTIYYAIADDRAQQVIELLYRMYCAPKARQNGRRHQGAEAAR